MRRFVLASFTLGVVLPTGLAAEPKVTTRAISEAESVIAVYRKDHGLGSASGPGIILVAWPDGHVVWSADRLKGGAPYREGKLDPARVASLLERFEKDGLFADKELNHAHFGPDSDFISVLIKSGKKQVNMQSWHELFEENDKLVVDHRGVSSLEGRRRLDVLRNSPAEYQFFRLVWSETRAKVGDLIPGESTASAGGPVMEAGVLSWRHPDAKPTKK